MNPIRRFVQRTVARFSTSFQPADAAVATRFSAANRPTLLKEWQSVSLSRGGGTVVTCVRGLVWVTQAGDPRDVVVVAGDSFACDRDSHTIVQALQGEAEIMLHFGRAGGLLGVGRSSRRANLRYVDAPWFDRTPV